jgi:hypothetical protein
MAAETQQTSARNFVQSFYDWYVPIAGAENNEPACAIALQRRPESFSPVLSRAVEKELAAQAAAHEVLHLDFDPILNSQDPAPRFALTKVSHRADHDDIDLDAIYNDHREHAVTARVKQQDGRWIFTDFLYENGDSLSKLLHFRAE